MKKMICTVIGLCAVLSICAQDANILKNGGFEKIYKTNKKSAMIKAKIKQGWNFGKEQNFLLPQGWILNVGAANISLVNKAKAPKDVHSGKYALKMISKKFAHIFVPGLKPGKYTITFWAKGKGLVTTVAYCYGAKSKFLSSSVLKVNQIKDPEWKKFTQVFDIKKLNAKMETFAFAASFNGTVIVDDFSLTPAK